jgi:hypothetical protein
MRKVVKSWFIRSLGIGGVVMAIGACSSDEDDDGNGGDSDNGTAARSGSSATAGRSGGGAGTSGRAGTGGTASNGTSGRSNGTAGGSTGTAGRPQGTGGSSGGVVPECTGLPFVGAAGGGEEACVGVDFEAEPLPADLFIMMDRSISQSKEIPGTNTTRWDALRDAVKDFAATAADSDIRVGIGFFGRTGGRDDELDCDVDYYATPKVEIAPLADVGDDLVSAIEDQVPSGLTPTRPALEGALQYATEYARENPQRVVSVLLVTDGFPTQCTAVASVSDLVDLAEMARTTEPYVRTFVIGLAAEGNLNSIARAGGTNGAYLVDEGDTTASFSRALENITNTPVPCEFEIPEPPQGEVLNPDEVQVVYTPAVGDAEEIPRLASRDVCTDQRAKNGGWYYDDNDAPTRVRVCPCTCSRFGAGNVEIRLGCEPQIGIR